MTGIRLSKAHGLNPAMALCSRCGKETGEIFLIGKCNRYECRACGRFTIGKHPIACMGCHSTDLILVETDIKAPRFSPGGLCPACKETLEQHNALVRQGGIFWRCQNCDACGVIRPGTPMALMIRHKLGIVAPAPCGVEFDDEDCPVCGREGKQKCYG